MKTEHEIALARDEENNEIVCSECFARANEHCRDPSANPEAYGAPSLRRHHARDRFEEAKRFAQSTASAAVGAQRKLDEERTKVREA